MAQRKLQVEIDRTLKKVTEGVEVFDSLYDKIQMSMNMQQKEKLEAELKTQIKKLQRLRDQIKTWVQSSEIKDKKALIDNRKLIETCMEKFKACEKEMKTKAFSKEGLNAATRLDPREREKQELSDWLGTQVQALEQQVETSEAEIETLQGVVKKKKDAGRSERVDELESLNQRRKWHIGKLELMLRLVENGKLAVDLVQTAKDDILYFIESNTEEDFEEDEGLYDAFNLDEEEELFGMNQDDIQSSHDSVSIADDTPHVSHSSTATIVPRTPIRAETIPKQPANGTTTTATTGIARDEAHSPNAKTAKPPGRKATLDSSQPRPTIITGTTKPAAAQQPAALAPAPRTVPAPMAGIRYAAAAASAVAPTAPAAPAAAPTAPAATVTSPPPASPTTSFNPPPPPSVPPTPATADSGRAESPEIEKNVPKSKVQPPAAQQQQQQQQEEQVALEVRTASPEQTLSPAGMVGRAPEAAAEGKELTNGSTSDVAASTTSSHLPSVVPPAPPSSAPPPYATSTLHDDRASAPSRASVAAAAVANGPLSDLVANYESVKSRHAEVSLKAVEQGYLAGVPQAADVERPHTYAPRHPFQTPSYYPQTPMAALGKQEVFSKLDVETIFYIFYSLPGTFFQWLAANELKKQSWRFHKSYKTWFQRASEPEEITDEYEKGVYLYYDCESLYKIRRKPDFTFEYRYLDE